MTHRTLPRSAPVRRETRRERTSYLKILAMLAFPKSHRVTSLDWMFPSEGNGIHVLIIQLCTCEFGNVVFQEM